MKTATNAPNKASEDIVFAGQNHATGTGHHLKTVAQKCMFFLLRNLLEIIASFDFLGIESKLAGKINIYFSFLARKLHL